ncbi:MAG: hypothetical protein JNK38_17860 [Acidobacteria bacterium]|nr:hypothetical protein [Acidobacteriota bacterium]
MVNPELIDLREKYNDLQAKYERLNERVAKTEGRVSDNTKQTIWQFAIFMIGMATLVFAILNYQTTVIERRFEDLNKRISAGEASLNTHLDSVERRMDRIEKNLDDLNKELRTQRK